MWDWACQLSHNLRGFFFFFYSVIVAAHGDINKHMPSLYKKKKKVGIDPTVRRRAAPDPQRSWDLWAESEPGTEFESSQEISPLTPFLSVYLLWLGSGELGLSTGQFFIWIMCVFCLLSPVSFSPFQDQILSLLHNYSLKKTAVFPHWARDSWHFFPLIF